MLLYLVRHGQSRANVDAQCRIVDCELTDTGKSQAMAVAAELARRGVDRVFASPYVRAVETAREIARAAGVPAAILPELHEHHGAAFPETWPLKTRSILAFDYPDFALPETMAELGWQQPPESMESILARMTVLLGRFRERAQEHPDERVVLVSHATPIQQMILAARNANGTTAPSALPPLVDNASVTLLDVQPTSVAVEFVNQIEHLRAPVSV